MSFKMECLILLMLTQTIILHSNKCLKQSACDVVGMVYLMSETEESPQVGTKIPDNVALILGFKVSILVSYQTGRCYFMLNE